MSLQTRIALVLVSLIVFTAAGAALLLSREANRVLLDEAARALAQDLALREANLTHEVDGLTNDTRFLAGTPPIRGLARALDQGGIDPFDGSSTEQWKDRLSTIFEEMLYSKASYAQIRLIGLADHGRELVRVERLPDGRPWRTPEDELQAKGGEPYFVEGRAGPAGEPRVSAFSLNREQGQIEAPGRPMLRATVLVEDEAGAPYALVVVNLDATRLLRDVFPPDDRPRFLLNGHGDYLHHPDPARAFAFERGAPASADRDFPEVRGVLQGTSPAQTAINPAARRVVAARRSPGPEGGAPPLVFVGTASFDDVTAVVARILGRLTVMATALVLVALALAFWLVRRFTRPLEQLAHAASDIDPAAPALALPDDLSGEAAELGRALSTAIAALGRRQDELERKNRELEQFNYITSHDLQEPLRTMSSFSQLIDRQLGDSGDPAVRQSLQYIREASARMTELVHSLLEYSRLGHNPAVASVDLEDVVDAALVDLDATIRDRGAELDVGPLPTLPGHPVELRRLFQNIIANALKFVTEGVPPRVRVRAEAVAGGWRITVSDNGIGIPEHQRDKVFGMFQRLHPRDRFGGTGIGLAECRKIVDLHRGRIWIDESPLGGTNVCFVLREP